MWSPGRRKTVAVQDRLPANDYSRQFSLYLPFIFLLTTAVNHFKTGIGWQTWHQIQSNKINDRCLRGSLHFSLISVTITFTNFHKKF